MSLQTFPRFASFFNSEYFILPSTIPPLKPGLDENSIAPEVWLDRTYLIIKLSYWIRCRAPEF